MIPASFIDEVVLKTDIVELISGYTTLQHRGNRWVGLCPFHNEKTPSFNVTPEKQVYHCFGCSAGGGVVQFVMNMENLSYVEAIEYLANRVGMVMPENTNDDRHKLLERLVTINTDAARWFHQQLTAPDSRKASEYLQRRGLSPAIVKRFGVGFAPNSWDGLLNAMTAMGHSKSDLFLAGLLVQNKTGGYYDKFRNRIMFPIFDVRKRVIAFGGRALEDNKGDKDYKEAKYLNSPETPLFNKSRQLYALQEAKATKSGRFILTEGYLDTLALYQAGFDCAVASLGTSLTPLHAGLIARYVKEAVIAYDSDAAGQKAAARAAPLLQKVGLNVRVLTLKDAKDPDAFIQKKGRDAFAKLLDTAQTHNDHTLAQLATKHAIDSDSGRLGYLREAIDYIVSLSDPIEREVYTGRVAQTAGVSTEVVAAEVQQRRKQQQRKEVRTTMRNPSGTVGLHGGRAKLQKAEEDLLVLLLNDATLWAHLPSTLSAADFSDPLVADVFSKLQETSGEGGLAALDLSNEAASKLAKLMQRPSSQAANREMLTDCLTILQTQQQINAAEGDDKLAIMMEQYRKQKGYGGESHE